MIQQLKQYATLILAPTVCRYIEAIDWMAVAA